MIIGVWLLLQGISKSSEIAGVGSALKFGPWLVFQRISESSKFEGFGPAVEVGFDYWGFTCITRDF